VTVEILVASSAVERDAAVVDLDLVNLDPVEGWSIRELEVRGPAPIGSLVSFEGGTPGFVLDGGLTFLAAGGALTGMLPIPRGFLHLDLTIRVHAKDGLGARREVDIDLPASLLASLPVKAAPPIQPGPPSTAQAAFLAAWLLQDDPKKAVEVREKAYEALKWKRFGTSGGAP
jgi:hypothetical protein